MFLEIILYLFIFFFIILPIVVYSYLIVAHSFGLFEKSQNQI